MKLSISKSARRVSSKPIHKFSLSGFTLVELIVVITILVILGLIAFLNFSNSYKSARDSVRVTALNDINKALTINYIKTGAYPLPDNYVTVVGVSKQWYVGSSVMNVIRINGSAIDPLDHSQYLYAVDTTGKKIQLSSFLEEGGNTLFSEIPSFVNQAFASSVDYTKRYVYNFWDRVGMLFDSASKAPITEFISGSLDLNSDSGSYVAIFSNTSASGSVSGTGTGLLTNIMVIQNSCVLGNTVKSNGSSITAYNTQSVAYNQTCVPVQRLCTNGVLGGDTSYHYDTCSPAVALNCNATTQSGYTVPALNHLQSQVLAKTVTGWSGSITATCTNGVLSYGTETMNCSTGYVLAGGSCQPDLCTGTIPTLGILNGTQNYGVSWTYNTTPGSCAYVCQAGAYWSSSVCNAASAGYYVPTSGLASQTACSANTNYQSGTGQTACSTVTAGYYTTPIGNNPHTGQTQCEANNYCIGGVKTACTTGYSSPVGSTSAAACADTTPPTITSVTTSSPSCGIVRFTVNGATDTVALNASPYSFDGGVTWQAGNTKDYSTTNQTIAANLIKVRDAVGNVYTYTSSINGTAASCAVNCTYSTYWWSCNAPCWGGTQYLYYTITAAAYNGGTCAVSQWQYTGTSQGCNTSACTYHWTNQGIGCSWQYNSGSYPCYGGPSYLECTGPVLCVRDQDGAQIKWGYFDNTDNNGNNLFPTGYYYNNSSYQVYWGYGWAQTACP